MENVKKQKLGMYGEMPIVNIGRFQISQFSDKEGEDKIYIQDGEDEGMSIDGKMIEKDLEVIFNRHF
jgi:hypothetical protein